MRNWLALAIVVGLSLAGPAFAMSLSDPGASERSIIKAYGGCGVFGHRGPYGGCRHGGQLGGYVPGHSCPRGFHIGFGGRHCFRN